MGVFDTAIHSWVDDEIVDADQLNEQLGDFAAAFGPMTSYIPVLTASGTAFALNNGTAAAEYLQVQKQVRYRGRIQFGSTTAFGTGTYSLSLPVTADNTISNVPEWGGWVRDSSPAADYWGFWVMATTSTVQLRGVTGMALSAVLGATVPITLAQNDWVAWDFWYPAA